MDEIPVVDRIKIARAGPGDVVVLELDGVISADHAKLLHDQVAIHFPDNPVLIFSDGLTMWVRDEREAIKQRDRERDMAVRFHG